MIDFGLMVSIIIAFGLPTLIGSWWTVRSIEGPVGFLDVAIGPAFAGLAVGRLTTLALDDPASIGSISDMVIIRSGVEFWPGVAAAVAVVMWSARRSGDSLAARMADLAPLAMIGYAGYEMACVLRDGCFGPESPIGLRPPGLSSTMIPTGWLMGAAVVVAAVAVRSLARRDLATSVIVLAATASVASVRAVGSIWLPHVGDGLTRQHVSSLVVAVLTIMATAAALRRSPKMIDATTTTQHSATATQESVPPT